MLEFGAQSPAQLGTERVGPVTAAEAFQRDGPAPARKDHAIALVWRQDLHGVAFEAESNPFAEQLMLRMVGVQVHNQHAARAQRREAVIVESLRTQLPGLSAAVEAVDQ